MKNLILLLTLILLTSSCVTQKRCNRKFPPQTTIETKIVTQVEYRDTIVYVTIPADTVFSPGDTVYIDNNTGLTYSERSELNTDFARSWAQVVNGILLHELIQKESEIEQKIKDAIKEHSTHTETVKETVREVNVLKWWQLGLIWIGGGTVALFLFWVVRQFNSGR